MVDSKITTSVDEHWMSVRAAIGPRVLRRRYRSPSRRHSSSLPLAGNDRLSSTLIQNLGHLLPCIRAGVKRARRRPFASSTSAGRRDLWCFGARTGRVAQDRRGHPVMSLPKMVRAMTHFKISLAPS